MAGEEVRPASKEELGWSTREREQPGGGDARAQREGSDHEAMSFAGSHRADVEL